MSLCGDNLLFNKYLVADVAVLAIRKTGLCAGCGITLVNNRVVVNLADKGTERSDIVVIFLIKSVSDGINEIFFLGFGVNKCNYAVVHENICRTLSAVGDVKYKLSNRNQLSVP